MKIELAILFLSALLCICLSAPTPSPISNSKLIMENELEKVKQVGDVSGQSETVIETLLVCDKEWTGLFSHNKQQIKDYISVYFSDLNQRFRTLRERGANIRFVVTGIMMLTDTKDQSFIENAKINGTGEVGRILGQFQKWLYKRRYALPKFDIALCLTNTALERQGGASVHNGACSVNHDLKEFGNTGVISDNGGWTSLSVAAKEIGQLLGASNHDQLQKTKGDTKNPAYFFSDSAHKIAEFVNSPNGDCMRRQDEKNKLPVNPSFSDAVPPTFDELCKIRLHNSSAFVDPEDDASCSEMVCRLPNRHGGWTIYRQAEPPNGSPCGSGKQCFRGQCQNPGSLLRNVGTNTCIRSGSGSSEVFPCAEATSPMDRFEIGGDLSGGRVLTIRSSNARNMCLSIFKEDEVVMTRVDTCDFGAIQQRWNIKAVGHERHVMIMHRLTRQCVQVIGNKVRLGPRCDKKDRSMLWQLQ